MAIDLNERVAAGSLTIETAEEQQSRLRREEADARHSRWRNTALFGALLVGSGVIFVICINIVLNSTSADEQKFAWAILSAIVSGTVGFTVGRARGG